MPDRGARIPKPPGFETEKVATVMQRVFVLGKEGKPLMPCHPARARQLLRAGRARRVRLEPFTIQLHDREGGAVQPMRLKVDPGSRGSGIALVVQCERRGWVALWAANIKHRGHNVHLDMAHRNSFRRGRRARKTRYRAPRFDNRRRPAGWPSPSIRSRVDNTVTWVLRLRQLTRVSICDVETVRFDTQKLQNPEISGVEYQRGELFGYEVREYLLEKWGRQCAYCDAHNTPLEIDHIQPRSKGGTDRVSNLTIACHPCNQRKNSHPVAVFLSGKPKRLDRILRKAQAPLHDAAAVNSSRKALASALEATGLAVHGWSGGQTKFNRIGLGYAKDHWLDAVCVGDTGAHVRLAGGLTSARITACGRGHRRVHASDRYGFPKGAPRSRRDVHGFRTGDRVRLRQPKGVHRGVYVGRLACARPDGRFDIKKTDNKKVTAPWHRYTLLQRGDGYDYA